MIVYIYIYKHHTYIHNIQKYYILYNIKGKFAYTTIWNGKKSEWDQLNPSSSSNYNNIILKNNNNNNRISTPPPTPFIKLEEIIILE